jgi:HK97 family phage major capsid protein
MFVQLKKAFLGRAVGERIDVSDADAKHLLDQQIAEPVRDDPLGPVIARSVEQMTTRITQGLDAVINRSLKAFADAQSQSRRHAVPLIFGETGSGDPRKTFGDWCLAVARNDAGYLEKHYGSKFNAWTTKAALAESSGVTGGYTVPPEFYQQLLTIMAEDTFVRPRAMVLPMSSATLLVPYLDVTTVQSAGVSPFFGGVKMSWTAEAQTRKETEPQFKQMELKAWELSGYTVSSNVLLQDSVIGLEKFLLTLFAKAIAWYEEYAFLQGSGVGQPQGIVGCSAAIATGGHSGLTQRDTANQILYDDVAVMWSKLLPVSWKNAIWAGSPTTIPQLLQFKDGNNRVIFISIDQGAVKAPIWNLLGRPFYVTPYSRAARTPSATNLVFLCPDNPR